MATATAETMAKVMGMEVATMAASRDGCIMNNMYNKMQFLLCGRAAVRGMVALLCNL
jgi:hypothetical protein